MTSFEDTCETLYYSMIESFAEVKDKYKRSKNDFQDAVEMLYAGLFIELIPYMSSDDMECRDKWKAKLRVASGEWYVENVQRKREQIERDEREREEREEREREERLRKIEEDNLREEIERLRELEEKRQREERRKQREKEERQRAEEEARMKAELEAKRKAQNEANKKKLAQMQAQWKAKQTPQEPVRSQSAPTETISCPQCGNMVNKTSKFCTNCGTKLSVTCPNCGSSLKAGSKFCTNCGTPMNK